MFRFSKFILVVTCFLGACVAETQDTEKDSVKNNEKTISPLNWKFQPAYLSAQKSLSDTFAYISSSEETSIDERMSILSDKFNWKNNKIDSVFAFGIKSPLLNGMDSTIAIEIWHKLSPKEAHVFYNQLNTLDTSQHFTYKMAGAWDWFLYKDKLFFLNYLSGILKKDLSLFKTKFQNDTLCLKHILRQMNSKTH